jgi:hypothetical protein
VSEDAVQRNIAFLEQVLANQRATLRWQVGWSIGLVAAGIFAVVYGHLKLSPQLPDRFSWIPLVAGLFPPALSAFPLKDIGIKRDKISALRLLISEFERMRRGVETPDGDRAAKLQQRFDQLVDRVLGG